jgi:hypothetical protein
MIKVLWISLLLSLCNQQGEYHVQEIWLFTKKQIAGNIPVDRNGRHLQDESALLFIYLKISRKAECPNWETAYINGKQYTVTVMPLSQDSVSVGTLKGTNLPLTIKAGPNGKLIQLMLTPNVKIEKPEAGSLLLNGTFRGKSVYLRSSESAIELTPDLMP